MALPEPKYLTLSEAAKLVAQRCGVGDTDARAAIERAFREYTLRWWGATRRDPAKSRPEHVNWKTVEIDWDRNVIRVALRFCVARVYRRGGASRPSGELDWCGSRCRRSPS